MGSTRPKAASFLSRGFSRRPRVAEFDIKSVEERWQKYWRDERVGQFDPADQARPIYSFDTPPPYASGALHCGHAVHYTHQDFMARYQRMRGHNVYFPLCFDVNGIPIEERVERERGITRKDIGRQEFIEICSRFADKNIENMTRQFERLGHCLDASIFYRTDSSDYRKITQRTFLQLLDKGLAYRGTFPINWCPRCMTAMADAEVEYQAGKTKLNYIPFPLDGAKDGEHVLIATTRPELIATCQVVAVHPEDEDKKQLVGKKLRTPIFNKVVDVIADDSVDPAYGTGALMVCSIGDKEDLAKILKYKLPMEIAVEGDGTLNAFAGPYKGMKIAHARAKIIGDLQDQGMLHKQEDVEQNVGKCWRCKSAIEYVQNPQWFVKTTPFKEAILAASEEMDWFPEFMKVRLKAWTDSLEWDWVVSRQRYFATAIPVWQCTTKDCNGYVAATFKDCYVDPTQTPPPRPDCPTCGGELAGCDDVFDTWMDSSISPLVNTRWSEDPEFFKRTFPMTVRPQSHDIIRTWLFYTIVRSLHATGQRPFEKVMMGGFILSPDGSPMHKSKGNVVDPLDIIKEYGAEALRYYATTCSLGEDNPVRYQDFVRGQRFATKFHNIQSFVARVLGGKKPVAKSSELHDIDRWILGQYAALCDEVAGLMERFEYAPAMKAIEQFTWLVFADHYLEFVKARAYENKDAAGARYALYEIGYGLTRILAPFLPHVTEDGYQNAYRKHEQAESVHLTQWPTPAFDAPSQVGPLLKDIAAVVRTYKSEQKLNLGAELASLRVFAGGDLAKSLAANVDDLKWATQARAVEIVSDANQLQKRVVAVKPNFSKIGPDFKQQGREIGTLLKQTPAQDLRRQMRDGKLSLTLSDGSSVTLEKEHYEFEEGYTVAGQSVDVLEAGPVTVAIEK